MGALEGLMHSWVVYPSLFGISAADSVIPVLPSEAPLIMSGVYAASTGRPFIVLAAVCAALGAILGDHVTYFIGRRWGVRLLAKVPEGTRRAQAVHGVRDLLDRRGATALIVARFIPWGRILANLLLGATRCPLRRYTLFDVIGATVWAAYGVTVGYLGGHAFEHNPLAGVVLGLGVALAVSIAIEGSRYLVARRRRGRRVAERPDMLEPAPAERDAACH